MSEQTTRNSGQFQPLPVGTVRQWQRRDDKPRLWIKVAEPSETWDGWVPHAVWVWEQHAGQKVPEGFIIHHIDDNALNDSIANPACIIRAGHPQCHAEQLRIAQTGRRCELREAVCTKCEATYQACYQRKGSVCDGCRKKHQSEYRKRRYQEKGQ